MAADLERDLDALYQLPLDRRLLPDRRSGIDRRNAAIDVPFERRSGRERPQVLRHEADREEGSTLLQKARSRLRAAGVCHRPDTKEPDDGLR